ncbi:MAG: sensor histidine kinase, partial [bacterium]
VHTTWKLIAKQHGKTVKCYADPEDFVKDSDSFNKSTPLYIDSNLGDDVKGEELAKEYFEQGFENIYLATGYDPEEFTHMPWLKGVVGKEPPFLAR